MLNFKVQLKNQFAILPILPAKDKRNEFFQQMYNYEAINVCF